MDRIKTLLSCLTFLFVFSVALNAQTKDEKEVSTAVETLRQAMVDANKATLEDLTLPELSYGHSSGQIEDKATFVGNIVSGKSGFVTITLDDQTIKIAGDVAIVRHHLVAETKNNGNPGTANLKVLLIWQKQKGGWKLLARQAVKVLKD